MSAVDRTGAADASEDQEAEAILQELSDPLSKLESNEEKWRGRYEMLEKEGYILRPRLRPGWTPSWLQSGTNPLDCEDGQLLPVGPTPNPLSHMADIT